MSVRWSEEEFAEWSKRRQSTSEAVGKPAKRTKYGNVRVEVDGKKFDSRHEAEVYAGLMLRRRAGELWLVLRQVSFDLPGGIRYVADFVTVDRAGNVSVIDAKSEATKRNRVYINKRKQMRSEWDVEIEEV